MVSGEAEALGIRAGSATVSPEPLVIESEPFRSKVLAVLGDPEKIAIIGTITKASKTSLAISSETKIPPSTVYRKLVELRRLGLVMRDKVEVKDGRRLSYYLASFAEIRLKSVGGDLSLEVVPSPAALNRTWINLLWGSSLPEGT